MRIARYPIARRNAAELGGLAREEQALGAQAANLEQEKGKTVAMAAGAVSEFTQKISELEAETSATAMITDVADKRIKIGEIVDPTERAKATKELTGSLSGMSVPYKKINNQLQAALDDAGRNVITDTKDYINKYRIAEVRASNVVTSNKLVSMGDFGSARLSWLTDTAKLAFTPEEIATQITEIKAREWFDNYEGVRGDPVGVAELKARLATDEPDLEAKNRARILIQQDESLLSQQVGRIQDEENNQRAISIAQFTQELSPQTSDDMIDRFADEMNITDAGTINRMYKQRDSLQDSVSLLGGFIDPTATDVRKAVDVKLGNLYAGADFATRMNAAIGIAADTGIVAPSVESFFEGASRNKSDFMSAAQWYQGLTERAPNAYLPLSTETRSALSQAVVLSRAGMPLSQAAGTAWENVFNSTPETQKARSLNFDADGALSELESRVKDIPSLSIDRDYWFGSKPIDLPLELQNDYVTVARSTFGHTGDMATALETADKAISQNWVASSINANVKRNDEKIGLNFQRSGIPNHQVEWARKVLSGDLLRTQFLVGNEIRTVKASEVEIYAPNQRESRDDGQTLYTLRVNGESLIDAQTGEIARWSPQPTIEQVREQRADEEKARQRDLAKKVGEIQRAEPVALPASEPAGVFF